MSTAKATTDHDEIRSWVEERGGSPACVRGTGGEGDMGMLRIDFPGFSGEGSLKHVDWDSWFEAFEENELAFLHQDRTSDGRVSRFNKLVARDTVKRRKAGEHGASAHDR